jgi:hypothetical protein
VFQPKNEWSAYCSLTTNWSSRPLEWLTNRTVKLDPKLAAYECRGRIADTVKEIANTHGGKETSIEETISSGTSGPPKPWVRPAGPP